MFTGIVEKCGILKGRQSAGGIMRLIVDAGPQFSDISIGESVLVNGVCLSVVENTRGLLLFELAEETQRKTTLGAIKLGKRVNLEKAISASGRFNGHFVAGHINGKGEVILKKKSEGGYEIRIRIPQDISRYLINKGSVAVDGVSLTAGDVSGAEFSAYLIPLTLSLTNLSDLSAKDTVNIEADIIGKYVEKFMISESYKKSKPEINTLLKEYGYI